MNLLIIWVTLAYNSYFYVLSLCSMTVQVIHFGLKDLSTSFVLYVESVPDEALAGGVAHEAGPSVTNKLNGFLRWHKTYKLGFKDAIKQINWV